MYTVTFLLLGIAALGCVGMIISAITDRQWLFIPSMFLAVGVSVSVFAYSVGAPVTLSIAIGLTLCLIILGTPNYYHYGNQLHRERNKLIYHNVDDAHAYLTQYVSQIARAVSNVISDIEQDKAVLDDVVFGHEVTQQYVLLHRYLSASGPEFKRTLEAIENLGHNLCVAYDWSTSIDTEHDDWGEAIKREEKSQ